MAQNKRFSGQDKIVFLGPPTRPGGGLGVLKLDENRCCELVSEAPDGTKWLETAVKRPVKTSTKSPVGLWPPGDPRGWPPGSFNIKIPLKMQ